MRFGGYWVVLGEEKATLTRTSFDETELDPATGWKEAWQNQERDGPGKGYVELEGALLCAAEHLAKLEGAVLMDAKKWVASLNFSDWADGSFEAHCLSDLLNQPNPPSP
jgi:hypothetical protein